MLLRGATVEMNGLSAVNLGHSFDTVMSLRLSFQPGGHFTMKRRFDECSRSVLLVKFPIRWKSGSLRIRSALYCLKKKKKTTLFSQYPLNSPPRLCFYRVRHSCPCVRWLMKKRPLFSHNHMDLSFKSGGLMASSMGPIHFTLVIQHVADGSDNTNPNKK